MKKKINKSMVFFFIKMLVLFIIISQIIVDTILVNGALSGIFTAKYGFDFLVEGLRALFILVVLLLFGNSYIFKEKRVNFKDSVLLGWPMLIISGVYLLQNILFLKNHSIDPNIIINCIAFCITIGIFEEFLCRGWLQNEFIERFKKDKYQVIKSIVLSSLVFGVMHITNIWASNQGVFITIMQILQALSVGILLGAIYYKTKNIWSVVFLHAFYDFSLMVGDAYFIRDCETGIYSKPMLVYEVIATALICIMYVIATILVLRSETGRKITDNKPQEERGLTIIILLILAAILAPIHIPGGENTTKCFSYESQKLTGYYQIVEVERSENYFELKNKDTVITIAEEEDEPGKVFIKDNNGNVVKLDYNVDQLLVVDNEYWYEVMIIERGVKSSTGHYIKIDKRNMNPSYGYLNMMRNNFDTYDLPTIVSLGYVEDLETGNRTMYLRGEYQNQFIIDENNELYFVTKE